MTRLRPFALSFFGALSLVFACSSDEHGSQPPGATGGSGGGTPPGSGGAAAASNGGTAPAGSGGAAVTGGATGAGGGPVSTGGANSSGGAGPGAGGAAATGGTASSGGSLGSGGSGGTGSGGNPGSGGSTGPGSAILAPENGALLGLYYGDRTIAATAQVLGRTPPIHLVYYAFRDDWAGRQTKDDLANQRIPLVNWETPGIDFRDIVSGSLDSVIQARAQGAKALGQKFFLDFAAEMNGDEGWSGNDPALYVSAYRHIHDLFVAAGATNAVWAWCPNVTDVDNSNAKTMEYYPGDDYVDWTCVDGYNWGSSNGRWQTFKSVFARIYPLLAAKGKPILIGEMSSAEGGGDKGAWIDAIVPTLKADYPLIKGLVWFDVNKENDWRIRSSAGSEAAFVRMAKDPYFNP